MLSRCYSADVCGKLQLFVQILVTVLHTQLHDQVAPLCVPMNTQSKPQASFAGTPAMICPAIQGFAGYLSIPAQH